MNSVALLLALGIFGFMAFVPLFLVPKWSRFRSVVLGICVALAVLLIPSLYYQWDTGQDLMLVTWVAALALSIAGRMGKKPEGTP